MKWPQGSTDPDPTSVSGNDSQECKTTPLTFWYQASVSMDIETL